MPEISKEIVSAIIAQFCKEYRFLYENHGRGSYVAGYDEALEAGDMFLREESNGSLIRALVDTRHDLFTSDREVAALAFALGEFGLI